MWVGVPIFFVISGYCIAATADASRRKEHGFGTFLARRFRRIYPPYWVCLVAIAVVASVMDVGLPGCLSRPGLLYRFWWFSPSQWFGNLTLTELWRHHLFGGPYAPYLGHIWSLVYEEQFYLVTGLLLVFARARLFVAAGVVTIACFVSGVICREQGLSISGFFFDGGWTLFACGILVYWASNHGSRSGRVAAILMLLVGLAYSLRNPTGMFAEHPTPANSPLPTTFRYFDLSLLVATGFGLLILISRVWDGWLSSRRCLRPVFACGTMCYSLYLVHLPLLAFLEAMLRQTGIDPRSMSSFITIPVGLIISILVARVFYQIVERRFLNAAQSKPDRHSCSVTATQARNPDTAVPRPTAPDQPLVEAVTVSR
jgi:peptidoglycan/LPS O-acetylase OafA/YrhL